MYVHADVVIACKLRQVSPDEDLWNRVVRLHARIEHDLTKALHRRHGLGLADALGLTQSSVSRLVARLEDAGLSERDICEQDRRGIYTMITDAGRARYAEAQPTYRETLRAALDQAATEPGFAEAMTALRDGSPVP
jgi:DNA-binding MarR family transcriptional regulator